MAKLPAVPLSGRAGWRGGLWAAPLLLCLASGCVLTEAFTRADKPPAPGVPCQVVCTWQNSVHYAPDPVHQGRPAPGLAGRMYLFGPQIDFPMTGEGSLTIDLYDETSGAPVMLERWEIDAETVKKLVRRDMIGWGYTVFLPWSKYSPEISKVRLRTCFRSPNAPAPIYTENAVTLAATNGVLREGTTPLSFGPRPPGR